MQAQTDCHGSKGQRELDRKMRQTNPVRDRILSIVRQLLTKAHLRRQHATVLLTPSPLTSIVYTALCWGGYVPVVSWAGYSQTIAWRLCVYQYIPSGSLNRGYKHWVGHVLNALAKTMYRERKAVLGHLAVKMAVFTRWSQLWLNTYSGPARSERRWPPEPLRSRGLGGSL